MKWKLRDRDYEYDSRRPDALYFRQHQKNPDNLTY